MELRFNIPAVPIITPGFAGGGEEESGSNKHQFPSVHDSYLLSSSSSSSPPSLLLLLLLLAAVARLTPIKGQHYHLLVCFLIDQEDQTREYRYRQQKRQRLALDLLPHIANCQTLADIADRDIQPGFKVRTHKYNITV